MESFFEADFFYNNRRRLQNLFSGTAPIVLTANAILQRNGDINYAFRQDSNFWYLTGLDIPEAILVIDKTKDYLIIPDRSPVDEVFGLPHDFEGWSKRSGIKTIYGQKEGMKRLKAKMRRVRHVATLASPAAYNPNYAFYVNPARARLIEQLKVFNPELEILDLREHLLTMRQIKQAPELQALGKAIDITTATLKAVSRRLKSYKSENEIEADITHGFRKRGARGHGFSPIVAAGKNTCHLHQESNNASLKGARHLYVDVGADVENYTADITRTYFLTRPNKRERAIVDAVKDVAAYAMSNLKPGISIKENEKLVEHYMGEKLRELGLIKSIDREAVRKYYTHACSHYLGLDAHDVGDYEAPLQPGMVLTVEPGIYIPEEGFGVRIEDDVLVTKRGVKNLSKGLKQP